MFHKTHVGPDNMTWVAPGRQPGYGYSPTRVHLASGAMERYS